MQRNQSKNTPKLEKHTMCKFSSIQDVPNELYWIGQYTIIKL